MEVLGCGVNILAWEYKGEAYANTLASLLDSFADWTFFTLILGDCSSGSDDSSPDVSNSTSLLSGDSLFKLSILSSYSCIFLAFIFFFIFSLFIFLSLSFYNLYYNLLFSVHPSGLI